MNNVNIELVIKNDYMEIKKDLGNWAVIIHDDSSKKLIIKEASDLISAGVNNSINSNFIEEMLGELCQD